MPGSVWGRNAVTAVSSWCPLIACSRLPLAKLKGTWASQSLESVPRPLAGYRKEGAGNRGRVGVGGVVGVVVVRLSSSRLKHSLWKSRMT